MERLDNRTLKYVRYYVSLGFSYDLALEYARARVKDDLAERERQKKTLDTITKQFNKSFDQETGMRKPTISDSFAVKDPWGNVFITKTEMCHYYGITLDLYNYYVKRGWQAAQILKREFNNSNIKKHYKKSLEIVDHEGHVFATKSELCRYWKINYFRFNQRLARGWDVKEAILAPSLE